MLLVDLVAVPQRCTGGDLNPYVSRRRNLNPLRMPISPPVRRCDGSPANVCRRRGADASARRGALTGNRRTPQGVNPEDGPAVYHVMNGRDFVAELELRGFLVKRRSRSYVWLARGEQMLMVDEEAAIPEAYLANILRHAAHPPAGPRRSLPPRRSTSPPRPSVLPARSSSRPSVRPSQRP